MGFCLDPKNEPEREGWQLLTRCCGKNADQARACAACKGANWPPDPPAGCPPVASGNTPAT